MEKQVTDKLIFFTQTDHTDRLVISYVYEYTGVGEFHVTFCLESM